MIGRTPLLLAALALGAAPASAVDQRESPGLSATPAFVAIHDMAVAPVDLIVAPGSRIVWTNAGRKRHTVTSDVGAFESGTLLPGETFSIAAPMTVGTLSYHCRFHHYIRGSVTVSLVGLRAPAEVPYGRGASLTGVVPGATAGTQVTVERFVAGVWTPLVTAAVGIGGDFSAATPPLRSRALLRASVGSDLSPTAVVGARPLVSARRMGRAIEARVTPARRGLEVRLERLDIDRYIWHSVASARLDPRGRARLTTRGAGVYRVRLPRGLPGVDGGTSPAVPVRG